jgi:hypothetical protein
MRQLALRVNNDHRELCDGQFRILKLTVRVRRAEPGVQRHLDEEQLPLQHLLPGPQEAPEGRQHFPWHMEGAQHCASWEQVTLDWSL